MGSSMESLKTGTERIKFLLENYAELRDNDKKLWVSYLIMFHNLQDVLACPQPFDALCDLLLKKDVCGAETMRRIRQKFQQKGLYTPSEKIDDKKNSKAGRCLNVKSRVEHLLKNYSALRDCDIQLWLSYLIMFYGMKERLNTSSSAYDEFCDIIFDNEVPAIDTIRRNRQLFQEKGLYLGTKRRSDG